MTYAPKDLISLRLIVVLLVVLFATSSPAGVEDPLFASSQKPADKVSELRAFFNIPKSQITDEELRAYYSIKANAAYADSVICMMKDAANTEGWSSGTLNPVALEEVKYLYSKISQDVLLGLLTTYWDALGYSYILPFRHFAETFGSVSQISKLVNFGVDSMTSYSLRSMVGELYVSYKNDRDAGRSMSEIYHNIFGPGGIYEQDLRAVYEDYLNIWIGSTRWSKDLVYTSILSKLEDLYLFRESSQREAIKATILWQAEQNGVYRPLQVSVLSSTVEQGTSVSIAASGLSKKGTAEYSLYFENNVLSSGNAIANLQGYVDLTIPTDCNTTIGRYDLTVTDRPTGKSATLSYTIAPSLACDFTPPQLLKSAPYNGEVDVPANIKEICFQFTEPMEAGFNVHFIGISDDLVSGSWISPNEICFQFLDVLPNSTEIQWVLNWDPTAPTPFRDLAGNALAQTSGSFTTLAATPVGVILVAGEETWNATMQASRQYTVPEGENRILVITFSESFSWFSGAMGGYASFYDAQFYLDGIPMNVGAMTPHGWNIQLAAAVFYMVNPPVGEATLSWNISTDWIGRTGGFIATTLFNCDTVNPIAGSSPNRYISTTADNALLVDAAEIDVTSPPPDIIPGPGQIKRGGTPFAGEDWWSTPDRSTYGYLVSSSKMVGQPGSYDMTWGTPWYASCVVAFKPLGATSQ